MSKTLYIMRGLPGSGKSTKAAILQPDLRFHCSADHFYMVNGEYRFDINLRGVAHRLCQTKARLLMEAGVGPVVIDNTNILMKDIKVYLNLAKDFDYTPEYVTSDAPWAWDVGECFLRNTHNVPLSVIQNMYDNYRDTVGILIESA